MRNAVKYFLHSFHYRDPVTGTNGNQYIWGRDENEMASIADPIIQNFLNLGYEVTDIDPVGPAWVLLDKAQLYQAIEFMGSNGYIPFMYQVGEKYDWVPSRDDPNVNPGSGPASKNNLYDPKNVGKGKQGGIKFDSLVTYLLDLLSLAISNGIPMSRLGFLATAIKHAQDQTITQAELDAAVARYSQLVLHS